MTDSIPLWAFLAGTVSAISMPLGSLTTLFWQPKSRILAFLIAFGAGGLLAALALDLVGSALEKGHLLELILGSILGSLFFSLVNTVVNQSGGFLRKSSTTYYYLEERNQKHLDQLRLHLQEIAVFATLPEADLLQLARRIIRDQISIGETIYQPKDPCESLYIVARGRIELVYPDNTYPIEQVIPYRTFGEKSFLTGSPHATEAKAVEETQLWILPRPDFCELLQISPALGTCLIQYLQSQEVAEYLRRWQRLSPDQIQSWVTQAVESIQREGILPGAVALEQKQEDFLRSFRQIKRFSILCQLPLDDAEELAERLIYRVYDPNTTFFRRDEPADRVFVIESGEVALIDPKNPQRHSQTLSPGDAFGGMAFLTGVPHTVTAFSTAQTGVWILRKQDFDELLKQSPALDEAVIEFLQQEQVTHYLQQKQDFNPQSAAQWSQQALRQMNAQHLIPSAAEMTETIEAHGSAPVAIWLGLLMDGIPEALVIGATVITATPSFSLLAGVFLSNYPEALSSSQGMRQQGFQFGRILLMWSSITLVTGILAAIGSVIFVGVPDFWVSLVEAMAAGAMLTVIAETMLPEAYAMGRSVVGMSTLLGFLVIIWIKSWE